MESDPPDRKRERSPDKNLSTIAETSKEEAQKQHKRQRRGDWNTEKESGNVEGLATGAGIHATLNEESPKLDEKERKFLLKYTSSKGCRDVNGCLRGIGRKKFKHSIMATSTYITIALKKLPNHEGTVHRGTGPMEGVTFQVGGLFKDDGFMSTSRELLSTKQFTKDDGYSITIASKTGRDISEYSDKTAEYEVLFLPGTLFIVESIEYRDEYLGRQRLTLVRMKEVDVFATTLPFAPSHNNSDNQLTGGAVPCTAAAGAQQKVPPISLPCNNNSQPVTFGSSQLAGGGGPGVAAAGTQQKVPLIALSRSNSNQKAATFESNQLAGGGGPGVAVASLPLNKNWSEEEGVPVLRTTSQRQHNNNFPSVFASCSPTMHHPAGLLGPSNVGSSATQQQLTSPNQLQEHGTHRRSPNPSFHPQPQFGSAGYAPLAPPVYQHAHSPASPSAYYYQHSASPSAYYHQQQHGVAGYAHHGPWVPPARTAASASSSQSLASGAKSLAPTSAPRSTTHQTISTPLGLSPSFSAMSSSTQGFSEADTPTTEETQVDWSWFFDQFHLHHHLEKTPSRTHSPRGVKVLIALLQIQENPAARLDSETLKMYPLPQGVVYNGKKVFSEGFIFYDGERCSGKAWVDGKETTLRHYGLCKKARFGLLKKGAPVIPYGPEGSEHAVDKSARYLLEMANKGENGFSNFFTFTWVTKALGQVGYLNQTMLAKSDTFRTIVKERAATIGALQTEPADYRYQPEELDLKTKLEVEKAKNAVLEEQVDKMAEVNMVQSTNMKESIGLMADANKTMSTKHEQTIETITASHERQNQQNNETSERQNQQNNETSERQNRESMAAIERLNEQNISARAQSESMFERMYTQQREADERRELQQREADERRELQQREDNKRREQLLLAALSPQKNKDTSPAGPTDN